MIKYVVITAFLVLVGLGAWCLDSAAPRPESINEEVSGISIGQSVSSLGVTVTPLTLLEDSRCPSDVTCIQAGTVRILAKLESGLGAAVQEFKLEVPVTTEAEEILLASVMPVKISTKTVGQSEYRFVFEIMKRTGSQ